MGFFERLKAGLEKTKTAILYRFDALFRAFSGEMDDDFFDELEEILILADVGTGAAGDMIGRLKEIIKQERIMNGNDAREALKRIMRDMLDDEHNALDLSTIPSIVLVIGVNGVGKTTSIAKIAAYLKEQNKRVILCAADTFRAAAIDQLKVWANRVKVEVISQNEGADPAAVVFDAVNAAKNKTDVLIIDTAGRLHNKKNLMDELAKINRVIDRALPGVAREVLLVLDATTGQNAVNQAKEFKNTANITGLVLTKLDGTAKGGIIFSVKEELGIPVKFIGVGEKAEDLRPFDAGEFVEALFS
ncbi:MAG TPA: signal recognition particle-docking protein FtsY [Clostridiales bacterium]|jgi:fused signal recognition particle receptor|nr:signal recognition particle-docking protein FtsY [Clostridiales bacterium]HCG34715.1 signal recognition particle-docking protein FtsY [Clostridiales bacterium]